MRYYHETVRVDRPVASVFPDRHEPLRRAARVAGGAAGEGGPEASGGSCGGKRAFLLPIRAMREHLGGDFPLMVDANMRWSVDEAIRAARKLQKFDLVWLEELTIPDDVAGHVRIVREGGLPIATGENLHTLYEFAHLMRAGGVTFPEPDVTNCGGITVWMKVAHLAEAFNLPVTSHGAHDLTVHLLAAVPNRSYLEVHGFGLERFVDPPLCIEDGQAIAPESAGHGLRFDWQGLQALRVR